MEVDWKIENRLPKARSWGPGNKLLNKKGAGMIIPAPLAFMELCY